MAATATKNWVEKRMFGVVAETWLKLRDVEDTETGAVIGLVAIVAKDVLVVVDAGAGSLVIARLLGLFQVSDIPDQRGCAASDSGTASFVLVVLVVPLSPLTTLDAEGECGRRRLSKLTPSNAAGEYG